jgi:RNA polymerase sigma-70 factor (ECF subfamily)
MKSKIQSREEPVYETDANHLFSNPSIDTIGMSKALAGLKPEYQQVIHMSYYAGFTLDEISKQFSIPLGTVKTRMRQALILLRRHFAA